jgi:5-methylcytosine-specific restriction endonuclease McrA
MFDALTTLDLSSIDDAALHGALKHTTGKANTLTAQLLAQLGELEARGLYRERACSSLYTYCVYELRMSEDEAQRRCRAARLARQFPVLLQMLAEAAIHLTGILLLGPHLTAENHAELLARARNRTKRELKQLVATLVPRADVPTLVLPLRRAGAEDTVELFGAGASSAHRRNTWAAFVKALAGPIRQLKAGTGAGQAPPSALASCKSGEHELMRSTDATAPASAPESPAPPAAGLRYRVQFTADQAYIDLLEEARDLLQHEQPDRDLVEVQRRSLQLLVEQLRRRKHAATVRPRASAPAAPAHIQRSQQQTKPRGRHLPAALRRAVWQRDGGRCAYSDERGVRCRETAGLEFHHQAPYARGGPSTEDNIALRCRAHDALAAEHDFGAEHMARCRQGQSARQRSSALTSGHPHGGEGRSGLASGSSCPAPG